VNDDEDEGGARKAISSTAGRDREQEGGKEGRAVRGGGLLREGREGKAIRNEKRS